MVSIGLQAGGIKVTFKVYVVRVTPSCAVTSTGIATATPLIKGIKELATPLSEVFPLIFNVENALVGVAVTLIVLVRDVTL